MEEDALGSKRRKVVTGHEVLAMLKEHENDVLTHAINSLRQQ